MFAGADLPDALEWVLTGPFDAVAPATITKQSVLSMGLFFDLHQQRTTVSLLATTFSTVTGVTGGTAVFDPLFAEKLFILVRNFELFWQHLY